MFSAFSLTSARARAVVRRKFGSDRFSVARHPHRGANRIFIAQSASRLFLVKQFGDEKAFKSELSAKRICEGAEYFRQPELILPEIGVVVFGSSKSDRNFYELSAARSGDVLRRIHDLSASYFVAGQVQESTNYPRLTRAVDCPRGSSRKFLDFSPALREAVLSVQKRPASSIAPFDFYAGSFEGVHGDIKLDNLVALETKSIVIDWEMLSCAPKGWDLACFISSAFSACMRHLAVTEEGCGGNVAKLRDVVRLSEKMLTVYNDASLARGRGQITAGMLGWLVAHAMLERVLSESLFKLELSRIDHLALDIVDAIAQGNIF